MELYCQNFPFRWKLCPYQTPLVTKVQNICPRLLQILETSFQLQETELILALSQLCYFIFFDNSTL